MKRVGKISLGVALSLTLIGAGGGAYASDVEITESVVEVKAADPQAAPVKTTTAYVQFDHPVALTDAIAASASFEGPVLGFRYENPDIVGEYSLLSDQSVEAFLSEFATN